MKERLKQIRKDHQMTQGTFATEIGLTRNMIARVETDSATLSDRSIRDICRIFNVNEEWLRTGEGDPYIEKTRNQEIAEFINDVMSEVDESFRKKLILTLSKMTVEEWELLERKLNELYNM